MLDPLTWDDTYAVAKALIINHPGIILEQVSLHDIYTWTLELANFADDPQLSNDAILMAIYCEWFEEVN